MEETVLLGILALSKTFLTGILGVLHTFICYRDGVVYFSKRRGNVSGCLLITKNVVKYTVLVRTYNVTSIVCV